MANQRAQEKGSLERTFSRTGITTTGTSKEKESKERTKRAKAKAKEKGTLVTTTSRTIRILESITSEEKEETSMVEKDKASTEGQQLQRKEMASQL